MTAIEELIDCLRRGSGNDVAIGVALAHLQQSPGSACVDESPVGVGTLLTAYRRRLKRQPSDVVGIADLVEHLEAMPEGSNVLLAVYERDRRVTTIFRTRDGDLVGVVVGPDRRVALESDEDSP